MTSSNFDEIEQKKFQERRGKRIRAYGISVAEYDEMFEYKNGCCWICEKEEGAKSLCIDHDHKTNQVRGLLCDACNKGLGCFLDKIELLEKAIDYLEKHEIYQIKKQNNQLEKKIFELLEKVENLSQEYRKKVFEKIVYFSLEEYEDAKAAETFSNAFHLGDFNE
jgi:hypothetical protein